MPPSVARLSPPNGGLAAWLGPLPEALLRLDRRLLAGGSRFYRPLQKGELTMTFPDISNLNLDELLELRAAIDSQLQEKRNALLAEAQRVDGVIGNGTKKRRGRKPKDEAPE